MELENYNKKLLIPIAILSILLIITLVGYIIYYSEDISNPELDKLKKSFRECEENNDGEFCCREEYVGKRLVERECRQFDTPIDSDYWIPAEGVGSLAGTGSMLPFMDGDDKTYFRYLTENESLWLGRVYAYQYNESNTNLHRLMSIYVGEDGIEYYIFKGDNAIRADVPVTRDKIERELIGVCFNGYC